jgi:argininosuccinate lyase
LARGSAARLLGDHVTLLATIKGLPSSYNKDLQDDKRALFDAVDTLLLVIPAFQGALAESTFQREKMAAAVSSSMMATDLADYLVRRGATFREAHAAVGGLIRRSETEQRDLRQFSAAVFADAHPLFGPDVLDALDVAHSLEQREVEGGTGPQAVSMQLAAARSAIQV